MLLQKNSLRYNLKRLKAKGVRVGFKKGNGIGDGGRDHSRMSLVRVSLTAVFDADITV